MVSLEKKIRDLYAVTLQLEGRRISFGKAYPADIGKASLAFGDPCAPECVRPVAPEEATLSLGRPVRRGK